MIRHAPYTQSTSGHSPKTSRQSARWCGNHTSSLSKNAMYFPWARSSPVFRAPYAPWLSCRTYRTGCSHPRVSSATSAAVSSVLPSSTTTNSQSVNVWDRIDANAWGRNFARLYVGRMTLTAGAASARDSGMADPLQRQFQRPGPGDDRFVPQHPAGLVHPDEEWGRPQG